MTDQAVSAEAAAERFGIRNGPLALLAGAAVLVVLHEGAEVFAPMLVSVLLAYALEPFVRTLISLRLPRVVAAIVVYAAIAVAAIGLGRTAQARITRFLHDLPPTIASMRVAIARNDDGKPGALDRVQSAVKDIQATSVAPAPPPPGDVKRVVPVQRPFTLHQYLVDAGVSVFGSAIRFFAIATLTFIFVTTGDLLKRKAIRMAGPHLAERQLTLDVIKSIDRQIERYLLVRLLISAIVASLTWAALWSVGFHNASVWGLIAGGLNVIPFIGPAVACAAITAGAALQFHAIQPTAIAGAAAVAIAAIEGNLISPWLTSRAGDINTVSVFIAILFWGWTWGVWGLVLAVPITVALKAAADHIDELRPIGELLGR